MVYIGIYLFMNLAAFAIVAFLRNAIGSEEIADYAGLVRRSPGLTVCMAIVMFSLVGLPPLAGFPAKFVDLLRPGPGRSCWPLLFVGVLNTVLSLFYYLRVVRVMIVLARAAVPPGADDPACFGGRLVLPAADAAGGGCCSSCSGGAAGLGQRGRLRPVPLMMP